MNGNISSKIRWCIKKENEIKDIWFLKKEWKDEINCIPQ